jgi:O-antigen/teichoic acid export membrane protein
MSNERHPVPSEAVPYTTPAVGGPRRVKSMILCASVWKRLAQRSRLLGVFASLAGSQLGAAMFGLVFWAVAARALTPEQVGVGAALVAAMTVLSIVGVLGVGTLLIERLRVVSMNDRRPLFSTGLSIAGMGGALVAAGGVGLSELLNVPGALGGLSLDTMLLLIGTTGVAATCLAFDEAAIGLGASSVQLRRNLVAAALRIAVLIGAIEFGIKSGQVILISWTVGFVGSLLASPLRRHLPPRARVTAGQRRRLVRDYWTVAIGHHGLTLAMASSGLALPLVVASIMPATQVAYFAPARLLTDTILVLPYLLSIALFATAENTEGFRQKAAWTLILGIGITLSATAGAALFGRFVLLIFGASYARQSLPLLLLLLAAGPALVVKDHFVVLRRLQGKRRHGAVTMGLWTAAELAGALVGGLVGGITMLCIGWLAMSAVCALIALPVLLRAMRRPRSGDYKTLNSENQT